MPETKVTDSLQTQVPAPIRKRFKVSAGDIVQWEESSDGSVPVTFRRRRSLADLVGKAPGISGGDAVRAKRKAQRGGR